MKRLFIPALLCSALVCVLLAACSETPTSVTIDGKEVTLRATVQECLDNGLVTTDVSGFEITPTTELKAREVSYDGIYLGNDQYPQKCPVYVRCYNPANSAQNITSCKIMEISYSPEFDSADYAPVLVDGIDFWGMKGENVMDVLEANGLKPEKLADTLITAKKGNVSWTVKLLQGVYFNSSSEDPQKPAIEFEYDTLYVSEVELSIRSSLNIKITTK